MMYENRDDTRRNRQMSRRKLQMLKRRRRKLIAVMIVILLLPVAGLFALLNAHPVFLKHDVIEQELKEALDPLANIRFVFGGKADEVEVDENVDLSKPGDYPVTYRYGKYKKQATVRVRDTKAPELKLKPYTTDLSEEIRPEEFVEKAEDASGEVQLSFVKPEKWDKAKEYRIEIAAEDSSGNRTVEKTVLTRKEDTEGPKIEGADDLTVKQGRIMDMLEGVTVSDDLDPDPVMDVDSSQPDFNTPGTYHVFYTAKDRSGNETKIDRKVVVEENEEMNDKVVYLTFDDGPSENTAKVLDVLDKYGAKATFFVTGNNRQHDDLIKRAHAEGHAIGLHTYTHDYEDVYASKDAYYKDLKKISDLVEKLTGEKSMLIRFPGGSSNTVSTKYTKGIMTDLTKEVQEKGYQYFDWNCDSTDASGNNVPVKTLVKNATSGVGDHINILMHDTDAKDTTVEALPDIIEYYREKGYSFRALTVDSFAPHHHVNN